MSTTHLPTTAPHIHEPVALVEVTEIRTYKVQITSAHLLDWADGDPVDRDDLAHLAIDMTDGHHYESTTRVEMSDEQVTNANHALALRAED